MSKFAPPIEANISGEGKFIPASCRMKVSNRKSKKEGNSSEKVTTSGGFQKKNSHRKFFKG